MTKKRTTYWRRKKDKIIAEGVSKGKTIYLFTLPSPDEFIRRVEALVIANPELEDNPSFFKGEKMHKIIEKITRLDMK